MHRHGDDATTVSQGQNAGGPDITGDCRSGISWFASLRKPHIEGKIQPAEFPNR